MARGDQHGERPCGQPEHRLGHQKDAPPRKAVGQHPAGQREQHGRQAIRRSNDSDSRGAPGAQIHQVAQRHYLHPRAQKRRPLRRPIPAERPHAKGGRHPYWTHGGIIAQPPRGQAPFSYRVHPVRGERH